MKKELNKKQLNKTTGGGSVMEDLIRIGLSIKGVFELLDTRSEVRKLRRKGKNEEADKLVNETYEKVDSLNNAELSEYIRTFINS